MPDKIDYCVMAVGLTTVGVIAGLGLGGLSFKPDRIYEVDINNDQRKDVISESYLGSRHIFLRQEDGSLLRLDYSNEKIGDYAESVLEKEVESSMSKKN